MLHKDRDILQRWFNASTRFIFGIRKYDHISPYSASVLGCSLMTFYELRVCLYISKLLKIKKPPYLFRKFLFGRFFESNLRLFLPKNSCKSFNSSFFVSGISLWNSVPFVIRSMGSAKAFKLKFLEWRAWAVILIDFLLFYNKLLFMFMFWFRPS